jgi:hypothetical protein
LPGRGISFADVAGAGGREIDARLFRRFQAGVGEAFAGLGRETNDTLRDDVRRQAIEVNYATGLSFSLRGGLLFRSRLLRKL